MKITVIGTGYVGLVSGACFSEFGFEVTCIDKDEKKIDALNKGNPLIYEPGLESLVKKNMKTGRLKFQNSFTDNIKKSQIILIAVGTPTQRNGHANLEHVFDAAKQVAPLLSGYTVVVNKSTVPVGTAKRVFSILKKNQRNADFDVASNPEFLREGSAIEDFMRPNRVVIGVDSLKAKRIMKELYRPLFLIETPIIFTSPQTAELIKYASNAFLATKITFINQIADLCEKSGADVHDVAKSMGLDKRIGDKFLHPGPGFGGSCFPKDNLELAATARALGSPIGLIEEVISFNKSRKKKMARKIILACGNNVKGKKIAILGLTFKPNTDDMRDSPSLDIIPALQKAGAKIQAYDPEGMDQAKGYLRGIKWCNNPYEALDGAEALVFLTEWNQFRALDLKRIKKTLKKPTIIDLRNIYVPGQMKKMGFKYISIGREAV